MGPFLASRPLASRPDASVTKQLFQMKELVYERAKLGVYVQRFFGPSRNLIQAWSMSQHSALHCHALQRSRLKAVHLPSVPPLCGGVGKPFGCVEPDKLLSPLVI